MDSAGNNRYELLFMDDDISDPLDNIVAKKKKQVKTAAAPTGPAGAGSAGPKTTTNKAQANPNAKKSNQAEKENKPLNRNDQKKPGQAGGAGSAAGAPAKQGGTGGAVAGAGANRKRNNGEAAREGGQGQHQNRNVNFKQQNGETREQRNNRRNIRQGGENAPALGDAAQPQNTRPFRGGDRGDRPPRNRNFEGGNRKREFDRQSGSDRTGKCVTREFAQKSEATRFFILLSLPILL